MSSISVAKLMWTHKDISSLVETLSDDDLGRKRLNISYLKSQVLHADHRRVAQYYHSGKLFCQTPTRATFLYVFISQTGVKTFLEELKSVFIDYFKVSIGVFQYFCNILRSHLFARLILSGQKRCVKSV